MTQYQNWISSSFSNQNSSWIFFYWIASLVGHTKELRSSWGQRVPRRSRRQQSAELRLCQLREPPERNSIKIRLPGKRILSKRTWFSENPSSGKSDFYEIVPCSWRWTGSRTGATPSQQTTNHPLPTSSPLSIATYVVNHSLDRRTFFVHVIFELRLALSKRKKTI